MIAQPDGEAAEIVRTAGAGEWVAPEEPSELANVIVDWSSDAEKLSRYATAAAQAARTHSRDRLAAEMLEALGSCSSSK